MKWILTIYEKLFKSVFRLLHGIEQVKNWIVNLIDGFFYQFIVAMLSLFVLFYRDIGIGHWNGGMTGYVARG